MANVVRWNPLAAFDAEIVSEAVAICRGQPFGDLRRPRIAHLRGVLAGQKGQVDLAIAYLTHTIRLDPLQPAPYVDLGHELLRQGHAAAAIGAYLRALVLAPRAADAYIGLGRVLRQQGRHLEAEAMYEQALAIRPDNARLHGELGDALGARGRWHQALESYRTALQLAPKDPDVYRRLGQARLRLCTWQSALADFQRGLELAPDSADLRIGAGEALLKLGSLAEAEREFYAAVAVRPGDVSANRHYLLALELRGRRDDAVGAWVNLGIALVAQRRLDEAAAAYRQALIRKADCLRALVRLGRVQFALGEPREAIGGFERAVAVSPQHAPAHVELGLALLAVGREERGWDELAWYHHPLGKTWRHVEQAVWDGSALNGRAVLLWADNEITDREAIYALRYARFARALGGRVIVECDPALVWLVRQMPDVHYVTSCGGPLLPFDTHAPLRHFPSLVRPARTWLPHVPRYLEVDKGQKETWRQRLGRRTETAIGLVWSGNLEGGHQPSESASLSAFAPLADVQGLRLFSLQLGPHADELLAPPPRLRVAPIPDASVFLDELAAVIDNLDLVIGVDSMVIHLAGALGKPVWVLLPHAAGWPWPATGVRTSAYPTMRLFRRSRASDWASVLNDVRAALDAQSIARSDTAGSQAAAHA